MNQKQMADIFNAAQMDLLAAKVCEMYTFGESIVIKQTQNEVNAYGKLSVFYIPCGECGNPLYVKEALQVNMILACEACGHETLMAKSWFDETCYVTFDANEVNPAPNVLSFDVECPACGNSVTNRREKSRVCLHCHHKWIEAK